MHLTCSGVVKRRRNAGNRTKIYLHPEGGAVKGYKRLNYKNITFSLEENVIKFSSKIFQFLTP